MTKKKRHPPIEQFERGQIAEIYSMFKALGACYDALPDKSGVDESKLRFDGFDGNNENRAMEIARELATVNRDIVVFNSHMPRLQGYLELVQRWKDSKDKQNLTRDDLIRITT